MQKFMHYTIEGAPLSDLPAPPGEGSSLLLIRAPVITKFITVTSPMGAING